MALLMLCVQRVIPSGTAPYFTILNVSVLKEGREASGKWSQEYFSASWALDVKKSAAATAVNRVVL
jgi:hypothetical protein